MWTEFVWFRTESRNWLIWIRKTWRGEIFTGFATRRISRMDLFHVVNFFRSAVSTECRQHVVSIYNLYSADPGFKSWHKALFFQILSNFYTVSIHRLMLHDFDKMKSSLNKSMIPEKLRIATTSLSLLKYLLVQIQTIIWVSVLSIHCHLATPVLPQVGAQRREESGTPPTVWHPTYSQEPALREYLSYELFNNRTVLVR
jgi:hypothetical protein